MRFPVTKRFKDKFTGVRYRHGDTYETTDEERAKFLQRGRYIGAETPAEDVTEAPVEDAAPAEAVNDEGQDEAGTPETPAEDVTEAPVEDAAPAEAVNDEGQDEAGTPETPAEDVTEAPVVTVAELADMSRGELDEIAPLFIADYDPAAFKNKGAVREAIEKVMAEGA